MRVIVYEGFVYTLCHSRDGAAKSCGELVTGGKETLLKYRREPTQPKDISLLKKAYGLYETARLTYERSVVEHEGK